MDVEDEVNAVESLLLLKLTPFRQGEKVLVHLSGRIYEAKVLEVDSRTKRYYVNYLGLKQQWDEWVGMDRLMKHNKENLQKQKAVEKEQQQPENPYVTRSKNRKAGENQAESLIARKKENISSVHEYPTSVVGAPHVDPVLTPSEAIAVEKTNVPMDGPSGSRLQPMQHDPNLSDVGPVVASDCFIPHWSLTNDSDLLDPDNALDFTTHILSPGTNEWLSAIPHKEFLNAYRCENLVCAIEMAKRVDTLEAIKEIDLKEDMRQCKATITSQAREITLAVEEGVRLQKEVDDANGNIKKMEVDRTQTEAEMSALRTNNLELLGRLSEAKNEVDALKEKNAKLLKKLAEVEAVKKDADSKDMDWVVGEGLPRMFKWLLRSKEFLEGVRRLMNACVEIGLRDGSRMYDEEEVS